MDLLNSDTWLIITVIGYPLIAVLSFPLFYWNARMKQARLDNAHAFVWGWTAALVDALVAAVFWPVWIVMFVIGFVLALAAD